MTLALAGGAAAEDIGVRLTERRAVLVPVVVNGQGPFEFLLDTGSTTTVVAHELAEELGLEPLGTTVVRTPNGTERVPIARVDRVDLGRRSARTVLVLCQRLRGIRAIDRAIQGVLGFNFLSRFQYLLDYAGKRLVFEESLPAGGVRLSFDGSHRSIVVEVDSLRLLLDTGATGVVLFRFHGRAIEPNPRGPHALATNEERRMVRSGWIRRLDVGGRTFDHLSVTLVPQSGLEAIADGLLPGSLFKSIYFDHAGRQVVLNPTFPADDEDEVLASLHDHVERGELGQR